MTGGSDVEGAEDNFPGEIDRVPKLRIVEPEGDHVLPQLLDVCRMCGQHLQASAGRRAQVVRQLMQGSSRYQGRLDGVVRQALHKSRWEREERLENRVEAVGIQIRMEHLEGGWRGKHERQDGDVERPGGRGRGDG